MDVRELRRPSVSGRPRSPVKRPVRRETRYDGFISYSHALDGKLAPAVQRGLGRFARPTLDLAEVPRRLNVPSEVRTADRPRSPRFEPAFHFRGFHDWFLHSCACPSRLPGLGRLAVPTCPVVVGAALASLGTSRDRLPPGSSGRPATRNCSITAAGDPPSRRHLDLVRRGPSAHGRWVDPRRSVWPTVPEPMRRPFVVICVDCP
jgi:hypothetical protein